MSVNIRNQVCGMMYHLCTDGHHGYTQGDGRWGSGTETINLYEEKWTIRSGDRDCSSAVISCWKPVLERYFGISLNATYTGDMVSGFTATGCFEWHPMGDGFMAEPGDIYLNESHHTAMCLSVTQNHVGEFLHNEWGGITGGQVGDQGGEKRITKYYNFPWNGVLHYTGAETVGEGDQGSSGSTVANVEEPTLGTWLDMPSNVSLYSTYGSEDNGAQVCYPRVGETYKYGLMWYCKHWTFQVAYITRRRKLNISPNADASYNGEDVWSDWVINTPTAEDTSAWEAASDDLTSRTMIKATGDALIKDGTNTWTVNDVGIGTYDCLQIHYKVRTVNEGYEDDNKNYHGAEVSEWAWGNVYIRPKFVPTLTATSYDNGTMVVNAENSNWKRGVELTITSLTDSDGNTTRCEVRHGSTAGGSTSVTLPAKVAARFYTGDKVTIAYQFRTFDPTTGSCTEYGEETVTVGGKNAWTTKPAIKATLSNNRIYVDCSNYNKFDHAYAVMWFKAADGYTHTLTSSNYTNTSAVFRQVPRGVKVKLRVYGIHSETLTKSSDVEITTPDDGSMWLVSDNGVSVRVYYNVTLDEDFTNDMETIKTVGNRRPISRYGEGGEVSLRMTTAVLRDDYDKFNVDYATQSKWRTISASANQDWAFIAPNGVFKTVAIESISQSSSYDTRCIDVTVSMAEVMD